MAAAFGLARAELRARWRALVAIGFLIGLVGAGTLGALAGARRTATAYERLEEATRIDDVRLLAFSPGFAGRVAALPTVERSWVTNFAIGRPEGPTEQFFGIVSGPPPPAGLFAPIAIEGRMFRHDRAEEIVVVERFARSAGLGPGDQLPMRLLTREEFGAFDTGFGEPDGPRIAFRIVGIIRMPTTEDGFSVFFGSPALSRLVDGRFTAAQAALLQLDRGLAGLEEFRAQVRTLAENVRPEPGAEEFELYQEILPRSSRSAVSAASAVLVAGLLAFAGVVLLVGGFITVQAVARYSAQSGEEQLIERALGMTRGERVLSRTVPAFLSSSIGAVVAVAGAIAASPLTPIGSLASYEPEPGLEINIALLGAGGAAIAAAVAAVFALITFRAIRVLEDDRRRTHSRIVERVSALGGSAPLVVGLRFAFERGRGRTAVPIRSALAGATLGVAGLIAVASFAASLDRLVATPERYGWQGDLQIVDLKPERRVAMLADRRVASFAEISMASAGSPSGSVISISGFESVRGSLAWTMLEGRMPATRDEIAVGPRLAKRLGLSVGSVLVLASPDAGEHLPKSVIGIGLGSTSSDSFGDDAVMTPEGFAGAARTQGFVNGYIGLADGVDSDAFARELGESAEIEQPEPPPEVQNLSGLGRLPALLAGILTLIAVAAIVNALVVGVRRRRRDIAILHALGFVRSQVARAVRTSAVAMTVTSLVVGLPIGLAVGRTAWRAVAETAYVAGDAAWARNVLILIGPAALVLGLAASVVPAMRASRLRPSVTLRTE